MKRKKQQFNVPVAAKCFTQAASRAMPSTGMVPLPNSSIKHRVRGVRAVSILDTCCRSSAKADCGADTVSVLRHWQTRGLFRNKVNKI